MVLLGTPDEYLAKANPNIRFRQERQTWSSSHKHHELNLSGLIKNWYTREQHLSHRAQKKYAAQVDQNLWRLCNILDDWTLHQNAPFDEWTTIYFSMLGQYIEVAYKIVYRKAVENREQMASFKSLPCLPKWYSINQRWPEVGLEVLDKRMLADGWCRSDIQRLRSTLQNYGLYYASLLKSPSYQTGVRSSISGTYSGTMSPTQITNEALYNTGLNDSHCGCSKLSCHAYQTNEREYKTRHVAQSCTCVDLKVAMWDVVTILADGRVPVVRYDHGLCVLSAVPAAPCVAIAHLWSEGLGNPKSNSLPCCQLKRISTLVNKLYPASNESIPFWNTLCCPVEPYYARTAAIRLMNKTYEEADRMLVLDSYLQSQSVLATAQMEILMMIHCSWWNRRLWTLQEQILARDGSYFQFRDYTLGLDEIPMSGPLEMSPEMSESEGENVRLFDLYLISVLSSGLLKAVWGEHAITNLVDASLSQKMACLQRLLPFRATTKASDEAICLVNMLKLGIQSILSAPKDKRMEILWSIMPQIPPDVIFWIGP